MGNKIKQVDYAMALRLAKLHLGKNIDRRLRQLSQAANHGKLWMLTAAGLAVFGEKGRAAAGQGIISVACASTVTNAILKPVFGGSRPTPEILNKQRRLNKQPRSGSFPSGHSASAGAFAVSASLACPPIAPVLLPVASAVAYSRMHTGAHWLSDVLVGSAIGVGIGTAVHLVARKLDNNDAFGNQDVAPHVEAPSLPQGEGLSVVVNPKSGPDDGEDNDSVIERLLPQAHIIRLEDDLEESLEKAVNDPTTKALGVCGGDGTVSVAAAFARNHNLPLAVFPGGTLNHYAKAVQLNTMEDTAKVVTDGSARTIDVADMTVEANDELVCTATVLNTFSLGTYPKMVQIRESLQPRFGKWVGGIIAAAQISFTSKPIKLRYDDSEHLSWLTFIGINRYSPSGLAPLMRKRLDTGILDLRDYKAAPSFSAVRFISNPLLGRRGLATTKHIRGQWHRIRGIKQTVKEPATERPEIELFCTAGETPEGKSGVDIAHDGETLQVPANPGEIVTVRLQMAPSDLITYAP